MSKRSIRGGTGRLQASNKRLALQNAKLAKMIDTQNAKLENSFTDLVSGLTGFNGSGAQTNITSMNPLLANNMYAPVTLMWQALLFAYRTHGLLQTAVDQPVLDALRGGIEIQSSQMDASNLQEIEDKIEEEGYLDRVTDSFIWARLSGGGALVVNSESDSDEPLGDEVRDGGKLDLYDACRWELTCERRIPQSGKYGFYGHTLDASRVMTIVGKRAPYILRAQLSDWGMSEIERMIEDFNVFLRARNVVYDILEEAKIDVFQLEGFRSQLATPGGTAATLRRIQQMNQLKNFNNALVLDKLDSFDQKQLGFGGLAEIMKENRIMIASALRMPMSKLFGMGSTGFSSGDDDIENYNSLVESEVRQPMKPVLRKVLGLVIQNVFGEEIDFTFKLKPLRILGAVEEENIKASKLNRFVLLYDRQLIDSKELGEAVKKEELIPVAMKAEQGLLDPHPAPADGQPTMPIDEPVPGVEESKADLKVEPAAVAAAAEAAPKASEADGAPMAKRERRKVL